MCVRHLERDRHQSWSQTRAPPEKENQKRNREKKIRASEPKRYAESFFYGITKGSQIREPHPILPQLRKNVR